MSAKPAVILVRTRFPENIGMTARAMANMGVSELILVRPERWGTEEYKEKALSLAAGRQAEAVLASARQVETTAEALAPFVAAYGATARTGGMRREILTPEQAAEQIGLLLRQERATAPAAFAESGTTRATTEGATKETIGGAAAGRYREGGRGVALVFGSEDRGLTNDEAEQCSRLITIPTAKEASSLNLAQAVLVVLYECMKAERLLGLPACGEQKENRRCKRIDPTEHADRIEGIGRIERIDRIGRGGARRVSMAEEALIMRTLQETLLSVGWLPEDNPSWFMQPLRRFLRRGGLRRHEFDMLMGICRKIGHALARNGGRR